MTAAQESGTVKTQTSRLASTAIFILTVLVLGLTVGLVIMVVRVQELKEDNDKIEEGTPDICVTQGCTRAAARVLDSLDQTADPCGNFYQFACGGFLKSHVIPEDRSNIDIWGIVRDNVEYIAKYLLEEPITNPNATAVKKAKDLYESCINTDLIEQKGISPALPLLKELGGWPILGNSPGGRWNERDFDLAKIITTLRKYNNKVLIDMGGGLDDRNTTLQIITFYQADFGLPSREFYLDPRYEPFKEAYTVLARDVAIEFGADPPEADRQTREMVEFETAVANITMTDAELRDSYATYNKMELGDMKYNFTEPGPTDPIQFSWSEFTKGVFDLPGVNITIDDTEPVIVGPLKYYQRVLQLVQNYPKKTIANYMVWRIMQNRARNLPQVFSDIIGEYNKVVYGVNSQRARWRGCMSYTILQLGAAVGSLYVKEAFDQDAKGTALDMIHGIRDAFSSILLEEEWMDEKTRQAAREKAEYMNEWIGYADDILDDWTLNRIYGNVDVNNTEYFQNVLGNLQRWGIGDIKYLRELNDKNSWSDPPTTVNAANSLVMNTIQFPAGIFQPPFYKNDQPKSMNYGGIGVIIGHEITHGFDDQGRLYDKEGNLKEWWDKSIIENFKKEAQCIVNQYGNFTVPEIGMNVNGETTIGENIADNGGLKQSFRAYRNWVNSVGHEEPLLPGVEYTNNQLFFINFAQVWCDKENPAELINSINTDPHSPAQFRVIGTLQNSKDFAETFKCRAGSFMNPQKKCSVWKRR